MIKMLVSWLPKFVGWSAILCGTSVLFCQNAPVNKFVTSDSSVSSYQPHLAFEAISIRKTREGRMRHYDNIPHTSYFHAEGASPESLILAAYHLKMLQQIENLPAWARVTLYTTTAKSDASTDEALAKLSDSDSDAERRHMLQLLLAERFHLKIHSETRTVTTYEVITTERSAKLMTPVQGEVGKTIGTCNRHYSQKGIEIDSKGCPFYILLSAIQQDLGTDILDRTGMTGKYAFHLMWNSSPVTTQNDQERYPPTEDAVPEQLGLELKPTKGPITFWVVDHIEPPTLN